MSKLWERLKQVELTRLQAGGGESLQQRLEAELRSEALAAERTEAESRAPANLAACLAVEEALTRKSLEAAEAARLARQAEAQGARQEEELEITKRARAKADKEAAGLAAAPGAAATKRWAVALGALAAALACVLGGTFFYAPEDKPAETLREASGVLLRLGEPLELRLERSLGAYNP
jgi:hypothetical protein